MNCDKESNFQMSETESTRSPQSRILVWLLHRIVFAWQQIILVAQQIMREQHVSHFLDMASAYSVQHPIIAIFLISMALCCGIPVLMFIIFAVLTVILTFTGFILIEGTILTVASVLLCGFLLGMLVVMLGVAATIGVAYFGFMEICGLFRISPENNPGSHYMPSTVMKQESQVCPSKSLVNAGQQHHNHHDD